MNRNVSFSRRKLKDFFHPSVKKRIVLSLIVVAAISGLSFLQYKKQQVVEIDTEKVNGIARGGKIKKGTEVLKQTGKIATNDYLEFESREIESTSKTTNAVVLKWDQQDQPGSADSEGQVKIEMRTKQDKKWSDWLDASQEDDRKDGTPPPRSTLVLSNNVEKAQYRFTLQAKDNTQSPTIDLDKSSIEFIDSTKGPSMPKGPNLLGKIVTKLGWNKSAQAAADSPKIYSRQDWGCPEANGTPDWEPEYRPLHRVIIHHTVTATDGDSFAAMRAIWQYHRYSNGWGDIGYNYAVDKWGNTFQGRYFDANEAKAQGGEVVAGHAYGNNYGTVGIAALGTYTSTNPSNDTMYSLARIAAYKAAPYKFNPAYSSWFGAQLIGHRDVGQTSCPGERLYARLQELRNLANVYYGYYDSYNSLDASYLGQGMGETEVSNPIMWPGTSGNAYIDVKNEGTETWSNSGAGMIMLGTENPRDRRSVLCSGSWLGPNCDRPATFSYKVEKDPDTGVVTLSPATQIATGEVARFVFRVNAPANGGYFKEHFNLLSAGRSWFSRNLGMYFEFRVPAPLYSWQYQGQGIYTDQTMSTPVNPNNLQPNTRYFFTLNARNTGNQPWKNSGNNPLRLATNRPGDRRSALCDSTWIYTDCNRPALLQESEVQPGETGSFKFWVKTPSVTANGTTYREFFNLIIERKQWLNDVGQYWEYKI